MGIIDELEHDEPTQDEPEATQDEPKVEVEVETPEKEVEAEAPTVSEEAALAALGMTADEYKKARNLTDWEKRVSDDSTALGVERKRIAEEAAKAKPADDDDPLDDESYATLTKAMSKILGVAPSEIAETVREFKASRESSIDTATEQFFVTHPDADSEAVFARIQSLGIPKPSTPSQATAILSTTYQALLAEKPGVDIDKLAEEKARRIIEEREKDGAIRTLKPRSTKTDDESDPLRKASDSNFWNDMRGD